MLRITNLTDRDITISKNINIKSRSYLDVQMTIDSRLYQLMNMGAIKIQNIDEKNNNQQDTNILSAGSLRRKQMMEKIRNGEVKPSVSLDVSSYRQSNTIDSTKLKRNKKVNK